MKPKLLLCDLDGTLAVKWEPELLDGRLAELKRLNVPVAIVTNQGGIHARYAWEARDRPDRTEPYPTLSSLARRFTDITRQLPLVERVYAAFYVGHDDYPLPEEREDVIRTLPTGALFHGSWAPEWRKPNPGMLRQACRDFGISPADALMVGDSEDDCNAATALSIPFISAGEEAWSSGFLERVAY